MAEEKKNKQTEELEPCPFGGGIPSLKNDLSCVCDPDYWYVECSCCIQKKRSPRAGTKAEAIKSWNTRPYREARLYRNAERFLDPESPEEVARKLVNAQDAAIADLKTRLAGTEAERDEAERWGERVYAKIAALCPELDPKDVMTESRVLRALNGLQSNMEEAEAQFEARCEQQHKDYESLNTKLEVVTKTAQQVVTAFYNQSIYNLCMECEELSRVLRGIECGGE